MLVGLSKDMSLVFAAWEQFVPVTLCPDLCLAAAVFSIVLFLVSHTCSFKFSSPLLHPKTTNWWRSCTSRVSILIVNVSNILFAAHRITLTRRRESQVNNATIGYQFAVVTCLYCSRHLVLILVSVQISPVHSMALEVCIYVS